MSHTFRLLSGKIHSTLNILKPATENSPQASYIFHGQYTKSKKQPQHAPEFHPSREAMQSLISGVSGTRETKGLAQSHESPPSTAQTIVVKVSHPILNDSYN